MGTDDRQPEWGEYQDRARQPVGPDGFNRRSGVGRLTGAGRQSAGVRSRSGTDPRGRGGMSDLNRRRDGSRSRFVAVLVLVVTAVIVIVGGIAAAAGDVGSATGVSISILPFPQETNTTVIQ